VPNCDFYALGDDLCQVLEFVFAQPGWELHEFGRGSQGWSHRSRTGSRSAEEDRQRAHYGQIRNARMRTSSPLRSNIIASAVPGTRRVQQRKTGGRKSSTSAFDGTGSFARSRSVAATLRAADVPERNSQRELRK
jgi:hypothetical protein